MLYIRVSTFSLCLRPTNSLSDSLPFGTGRYTYIHGLSFFNSRIPSSSLFPSLLLPRSFFLSSFLSRSFQSFSVGEKYIFVHRVKPLSPSPALLRVILPSSLTHSYIFLVTLIRRDRSEVYHEARFSRGSVREHIWIRVERDATEK